MLAPGLSTGRKWLFRIGALVLVPLALLALTEILLRIAGYGYPVGFFKKTTVQGKDSLVANWEFGRRFFPAALARAPAPSTMKAAKPRDSIRVFIFGESASQGDPRPQFGAGRYLGVLLRERFPAQEFEIVNTSMTAINSHVILPIAREAARHRADVWIVYMGNNEMVGPFGAATVFGLKAAPLPLVRLTLAIQKWRVGQLLASLRDRLRKSSSETSKWGGMKMFTQNEVAPDHPGRRRVYDNFSQNLDEIIEAGADGGAKIILSTVAVNLRDCPPFASLRPAPANQARFDKFFADAVAATERGNPNEAVGHYRRTLELLPQSADAHFRLAASLSASTNTAEARNHFEQARDYDTLPFRTESRLNSIITRAAARFASRGVFLCDVAGIFATNSPSGAPGHEAFYEHVHFNPEGNYRLALVWADHVAAALPQAIREKGRPTWATHEACAHLLGLTEWNRVSIIEEVIERMGQPPLSAQLNNSGRVAALKREAAALREKMRSASTAEVRAAYEDAVNRSPDDYMLREAFAEFLEVSGARSDAVVQRTKIAELTPSYYFSHLNLGIVLREERRYPEAESALRKAAKLSSEQVDVRLQLGAVYGLQQKYEAALREFALARRLDPSDPRPLQFAGEALWRAKRPEESIARLREAVQLQPRYVDARYRLGEELVQVGDIEGAVRELEEVVRLKPDHTKAQFNLGVAYARTGRLERALTAFEEVLNVEPQNKAAIQLRQQVLVDLSKLHIAPR